MINADDVDPLPDEGVELLEELLATLKKYVIFPTEHAAVATALWITVTHALPAFQCAPRLVITSPQKRCGKTRLLDVIEYTCHDALPTANASVAAVFRSIGAGHPPTIILDEADTVFGPKVKDNNEDLRALINAGHQQGKPTLRCVGPLQVPTKFPTFAMAAIAGIGQMPDTITDRGINFTMARRTAGERVSPFRRRRVAPVLEALQASIAAWAAAHVEALTEADPEIPVDDRAADTWEPLIAVADAAGGHWPQWARAACKALDDAAGDDDEETSLGIKLLSDIRDVFAGYPGVSFLPSDKLTDDLHAIVESPWKSFELTPHSLAHKLRPFGISPGHNTAKTARGYRIEHLMDVFRRYLRPEPSEPSDTPTDQQEQPDGSESPDGPECPAPTSTDTLDRPDNLECPTETAAQTPFRTLRTVPDGGTDGNAPPSAAAPSDAAHNGTHNGAEFGSHPPCFYCDKPVTSKQTDEQGRHAHLTCQPPQQEHEMFL